MHLKIYNLFKNFNDFKEIIGDALIVAFGVVNVYIFLAIEVFGYFGVEQNTPIRWFEMLMGIPMIYLGIDRFLRDTKKPQDK